MKKINRAMDIKLQFNDQNNILFDGCHKRKLNSYFNEEEKAMIKSYELLFYLSTKV